MKYKILTIVLFVFAGVSYASSQSIPGEFELPYGIVAEDSVCTEDLPVLSDEVYSVGVVLDRNYDYDLLNKRLKLIRLSNDLKIIGFVSAFAVDIIIMWVGVNQEWNSWVMIGTGVAGGIGADWLFSRIAGNIRKKADAIVVNSAPVANIGSNTRIVTSTFSTKGQALPGIGFGFQYDF